MQFLTNTNYGFVKYRWHGLTVSLLFILAGLVAYLMHGANFGIDFSGGANVILKFRGEVPLSTLRSELPDATIQQYGRMNENSVLIRLPQQRREGDYAGAIVEQLHKQMNPDAASKHDLNFHGSGSLAAVLQQHDPDTRGSSPAGLQYYETIADRIIDRRSDLGIFTAMQQVTGAQGVTTGIARVLNEQTFLGEFNVLNQETVGPQVGRQLQQKALWAVILSSLAMGAYIWLRFDLTFGVAAVMCLVHDVAVALAFMMLINLEFSLNVIAALLAVVGYSVNDTVVMYDRVRENKRKTRKPLPIGEHLDRAINQTLSRTVLTSGTTLLVLLSLLILGGDVIRSFAWILIVGVIAGTFSTLFLVPAVAVASERRKGRQPAAASATRADAPAAEPSTRNRRVS
jgi:preprotein translocase subunit SecF